MRFRSQARADPAVRIVLLVGLAGAITGGLIVREHGTLGAVLLALGLPLAALGPCLISGPAPTGRPSSEQKPKERSGIA